MKKKIPNVFLVGPSGAGKSTVGQELANMLKIDFYDSDRVIEERAGVSISWIFDVEGEEGFRKRETKVLQDLTELSNIVMATGGGAILQPENRLLLSARGFVVYLKATIEQQLERIHRKDHRPLLQVVNVEETLYAMKEERQPLYEEIADISFDTDSQSVKIVVKEIYEYLITHGKF